MADTSFKLVLRVAKKYAMRYTCNFQLYIDVHNFQVLSVKAYLCVNK